MSLLLSNFYPRADAILVSGNQSITGIKTFNERILAPEIRGIGDPGFLRRIDLNSGHFYSSTVISLDYFQRILSGNWRFQNRPTVSGIGVLLQGEAAGGGGPVTLPSDILYTTGTQTITGPKNFTARPTLSGLNLITTGDLVNLELNLESFLPSDILFATGTQTVSGPKNFTARPTLSGMNLITTGDLENLSSAFHGNRPIRQLPVVGTSYGGTTISGFLNNLFFPYTNATITLSNFSTIFNYGYDTINNLTFAGTLNALDDNVTGISVLYNNSVISGPSTPSLGAGNSYSISINQNIIPTLPIGPSRVLTSDELFRVRATGIRSGTTLFNIASNNIRYRFEPPYFYGVSPNANLDIGVTGLNRVNASTYLNIEGSNYGVNGRPSHLTEDGTTGLTFTFNQNGYIYIAYPNINSSAAFLTSWGTLATTAGVVDTTNFFDYTSQFLQNTSTIAINFPIHSNTNYRIYRSDFITPISFPTTFRLKFKFA